MIGNLLLTKDRGHGEWEARAKMARPDGTEVKVQAFGPTEKDAYECCVRDLLKELK